VDTAGFVTLSSIFFDNGIYIAAAPPNSSQVIGIARMELEPPKYGTSYRGETNQSDYGKITALDRD
jgi:hypothetical protein